MADMVSRMESLLTSATGPMSFAVVVPAWTEDSHWPLLVNSPFNRGYIVVNAADHSYCDGAQHVGTASGPSIVSAAPPSDVLYRPAPFDSAVFFLQNEAGHKKWPLTKEAEEELRSAFLQARPPEAMRKMNEDRGVYVPKFKRAATPPVAESES
jgi:Phosphorylated CTD interacting factor 1 WW domain